MRRSLTISQAHAWTLPYSAHQYKSSLPLSAPPFFHHYHHPPTILPSIVESLMYTDHPVLAHSRLVYRLSVINLTHAYPGTYVFLLYLNTRSAPITDEARTHC